jgi:hypothetical protein
MSDSGITPKILKMMRLTARCANDILESLETLLDKAPTPEVKVQLKQNSYS